MVLSIMGILLWMLVVPGCLGMTLTRFMRKEWQSYAMVFVSGCLFVLASFQFLYLWFVIFYNNFEILSITFAVLILLLAVVSVLWSGTYWFKRERKKVCCSKSELALWIILFLLWGFQMYQIIYYQFLDSDDAFYAAISVITNENLTMYRNIPYTGEPSALDTRHAFSSAPIFLSFLAKMCGMHPTIMTHSIYPVLVVSLTAALYLLLARILLKDKKELVPLFLIFITVWYFFGNASIYTNATFLLTRTSQGKSFLANVIPVAVIVGLLLLWQNEKEKETQKMALAFPWIFLSMTMVTGVYASTMGLFFAPFMAGGVILLMVLVFRKPRWLLSFLLSLIPVGIMGVLLMVL